MRIENKYLVLVILNSFVVLGIVAINFIFLKDIPNIFSTINILAGVMFVLPVVLWKYLEYRKLRVIEEMFPAFLRDFVESMRSGMTIEQTMKSLKRNDYKELNPHVKRMAAQLDWGVSVETVLKKFAKATGSPLIGRTVSSVIESHRFGGNLTDTFEALNNATIEIERLKAERSMYLYSQVMTGYIIFFVFLGVIIALGKFLIPSLTTVTIEGVTAATEQSNLSAGYKDLFRNLILIQGLFAGLSVGKMSEGAIISGVKHSLIMIIIGIVVFTLFG
jgi:flagellar protein FlaJ